MNKDLVKENERVDDLQNGCYVIQDREKFCFGMDAVLLSGFTKVKEGEKVLDMFEMNADLAILYHLEPTIETVFGHECCAYCC